MVVVVAELVIVVIAVVVVVDVINLGEWWAGMGWVVVVAGFDIIIVEEAAQILHA